jgi:hypothetical protein
MSDLLPVGCDLLALREHVRDFIEHASAPQPDGSHVYMPKSAVAAIHAFADNPTAPNAEVLLAEVTSFQSTARKCTPAGLSLIALREAVMRAALTGAYQLQDSIIAAIDADRHARRYRMQCEFIYSFMHLAGRVAYEEGGNGLHAMVSQALADAIPRPFVLTIVDHWPDHMKEGIINEFSTNQVAAEREYGECGFHLYPPGGSLAPPPHEVVDQFSDHIAEIIGSRDDASMSQIRAVTIACWDASNLPSSVNELQAHSIASGSASSQPNTGGERFTENDTRKFVGAIAAMLAMQLVVTGRTSIDLADGAVNPRALGYIYGFIDATLYARGQDISDLEFGLPIVVDVLRRLVGGKEEQYARFLLDNSRTDTAVQAGMQEGRQQYIDFTNKKLTTPMGLARAVIEAE